jgi:hypothetical protein
MTRSTKLRYHQTTLDLLGVTPAVSAKAVEQIERAEKQCRRK